MADLKEGDSSSEVPSDAKYLLLDSRIISRSEGVRCAPGTVRKDEHNPLFAEDKAWEPRYDNLYANVLFDEEEQLYKCWYSPFIIDERSYGASRERRATVSYGKAGPTKREMGVCYAVSRDGIAWEKPELGLIDFKGSTKNNIVQRGTHGAGVCKDLDDPDPARRYKMFSKDRSMSVYFSPDGLNWGDPVACPEIEAAGDTHNNTLRAPHLEKYVGITRLWDGQRVVGRTESADYLKWTRAVEVFRALPAEEHRQIYAMPTFRYANVYLGLIMMFNTDSDTVDCELAWSPDTVHWERVCPGTSLIPRGSYGSYDWGCIYAAGNPIVKDGEIKLYYGGNNGMHGNWRDGFFCLAHLRVDGFACMEAVNPRSAGIVVTNPIQCIGRDLQVSADAAGGSVRVAVVDADGFGVDDCEPVFANITDGKIKWKDGRDLSRFLGKPIQLQFELKAARLYAFGFSDT